MNRAVVLALLLLVCPLGAQEPSRNQDLSFLVPGKTRFRELIDRWKSAHPDEDTGPISEWDTEIAVEKPDILLWAFNVAKRPDPPGHARWIEATAEEQAKWHLLRVRVCEFRTVLGESPVDDPDRPEVRLAFRLDEAGAPDLLVYYVIGLKPDSIDWIDLVRRWGPPKDEEYVYAQRSALSADGEERTKYLYRRFPDRGVGYVWDAEGAEEVVKDKKMTLEEAQKTYYFYAVHFEPEKK